MIIIYYLELCQEEENSNSANRTLPGSRGDVWQEEGGSGELTMEKLLCNWTVTGGQESFVRYVRKVGMPAREQRENWEEYSKEVWHCLHSGTHAHQRPAWEGLALPK